LTWGNAVSHNPRDTFHATSSKLASAVELDEIPVGAAVDVVLPPSPATLSFSYRLGWDMSSYGATLPRTFGVTIEPFGGGIGLQTNVLLTAAPGTTDYDTGNLTASMDLSGYVGQAIRISFDATIPEYFTGPGFLQLDNVVISFAPSPPLVVAKSGTNLTLSWPVVFPNFTLQSATNLTPPVTWTSLPTNSITFGATNNALNLPTAPGKKFFRLKSL